MQIAVYSTIDCQPPQTAQLDQLPALLKGEGQVVWVDFVGREPGGDQILRDVFHFHHLAIEDTLNQRQRPKVEEYHDYVFSILNSVKRDAEGEVEFCEIDMFVGKNFLVTVHEEANDHAVAEMRQRVDEACSVQVMSPGYLLYALVDSVVDAYFPLLDDIGDEIEEIAELVFDLPRQTMLERLFRLRRTLNEVWRVAGQQRDMFGILMRENHHLIHQESLRFYMRDVYDHLLRISDNVNTFRDTLTNVVDLYMSSVSNRLNQQVNRLTIITMGIGLLAVITGFYGMNFERTWPPFNAPWGVPFVITLMVVTVGVFLVLVFGRRR